MLPSKEDVYNFLCDGYKQVYGSDIILTSDTMDGQWIGIQAQALFDVMEITALVYNSFSPTSALSDALDKNVRINGITRKGATYSMCDVIITGAQGTLIKDGSIKDTLNRVWNLPSLVTIPETGEITVTATASESGEWSALPNTLTIINTPTRGWQKVTNESEASVGTLAETDADLRRRQSTSVALPSQSILNGMIGAVATIDGVTRYRAYENDTNDTDDNGITAHSTCMVIEGGNAEDIANAIITHKTCGSGTYGDTSVLVKDRYGLETNIMFQRPKYNRIKIELTIKPLTGYVNTFAGEIKQRLNQYINNLGIGEPIYIARLIPPVLACNSNSTDTFDIVSIKAAKDEDDLATANIDIAFDSAALTSDDLITIVEL